MKVFVAALVVAAIGLAAITFVPPGFTVAIVICFAVAGAATWLLGGK